jgi:hypothetical protein
MTHGSPASPDSPASRDSPGDDQSEVPLAYGHGRMPLFMKLAWLAFLAFSTWYVVVFLLTSVGEELGG